MSSRKLSDCDDKLAMAFRELEKDFGIKTGNKLIVTSTYRTPLEQKELYAIGRFGDTRPKVTNCDGETKLSNHNYFPARAIDVAVLIGDKASWTTGLYYPLVDLAPKFGLVSGGSWKGFQDWPHLEMAKAQ